MTLQEFLELAAPDSLHPDLRAEALRQLQDDADRLKKSYPKLDELEKTLRLWQAEGMAIDPSRAKVTDMAWDRCRFLNPRGDLREFADGLLRRANRTVSAPGSAPVTLAEVLGADLERIRYVASLVQELHNHYWCILRTASRIRRSNGLYRAKSSVGTPISPVSGLAARNRKRRGRKPINRILDKQIRDAWETNCYESYADLAKALGNNLKSIDIERSLDRSRKKARKNSSS
jgi:hypothetical protein